MSVAPGNATGGGGVQGPSGPTLWGKLPRLGHSAICHTTDERCESHTLHQRVAAASAIGARIQYRQPTVCRAPRPRQPSASAGQTTRSTAPRPDRTSSIRRSGSSSVTRIRRNWRPDQWPVASGGSGLYRSVSCGSTSDSSAPCSGVSLYTCPLQRGKPRHSKATRAQSAMGASRAAGTPTCASRSSTRSSAEGTGKPTPFLVRLTRELLSRSGKGSRIAYFL